MKQEDSDPGRERRMKMSEREAERGLAPERGRGPRAADLSSPRWSSAKKR